MYNCSICDKQFDSYRKLNGHKSIHKEGGRYTVSRRKLGNCDCEYCGKTFEPRSRSDARRFCSNRCQSEWQYYNVTILKVKEGKIINRRFLIERDGKKCSCCNMTSWNELPIPLDVDHIDGDPKNNFPDNLRFLCPNCHRQTTTWGNSELKRSMKNGRILNQKRDLQSGDCPAST